MVGVLLRYSESDLLCGAGRLHATEAGRKGRFSSVSHLQRHGANLATHQELNGGNPIFSVSRGVAMVFLAVYRHSLRRGWPRWSTKAVYTSSRQRNALLEREEVVVDSSVYGVVGVIVSIGRFERSIVKGW